MSCHMCECECEINPQKSGIKPGVMHKEHLYCHECKDVLHFLGDDSPKKTKTKPKDKVEVEKPKTRKSVSFIKCPKCKVPVEKKCETCGFKNPLYR